MTLSYRKANALVHDTYFLSFKVFYRSLCEEKIHCVRARLSPERIILLFYSFESVTRFFMWFSSLPQQLDWIFILPNQVFGCCLTKQLAKTEETKIKITFFQDTISVRKNLKLLSTFQVQSRKELHLYGPGGDWLLHQEEQCQRWVQQRHHGHRVSGTTSGTVN